MAEKFEYSVHKVSERKLELFISSTHAPVREFDITMSKDGIKITIDGRMQVFPRAANQVEIDFC